MREMPDNIPLWLAKTASKLPYVGFSIVKAIATAAPSLHAVPLRSRFGPMLICDLRESVCYPVIRCGDGYPTTLDQEAFFRSAIKPSDIVFDVGANIGYTAAQFSTLALRIVAFEPAPRALALLRQTLTQLPNVELHAVAVSDKPGFVRFAEEQCLDVSHVTDNGGMDVPAITLDGFCNERGVWPTFLKIDVEGYEDAVLRGATEVLGRGCAVFFEALSDEGLASSTAIIKAAQPRYSIRRIAHSYNYVATVV